MKFSLKITEKHYEKALPNSNTHCPIALAMKERFSTEDVGVGFDTFHVDDFRGSLPMKARIFVKNFDEGKRIAELPLEIEFGE